MTEDELLAALGAAAREDARAEDGAEDGGDDAAASSAEDGAAPEEVAWEALARGEGTLAEAEADAKARGLDAEAIAELRALYAPVDGGVREQVLELAAGREGGSPSDGREREAESSGEGGASAGARVESGEGGEPGGASAELRAASGEGGESGGAQTEAGASAERRAEAGEGDGDGAAASRAARPAEAPVDLAARRRRRRALVAFGGALAAAAIALLVLFPRGAALPGYQLERLGGDASTRSSADAPARYGPTDRLEIRLRPETRVDAPVHAAAFVDGRSWDAPLEVSPSGAVRVVGPAGELLPDLGEHTIVFVLDEAPAPTLERHARRLELVVERIP